MGSPISNKIYEKDGKPALCGTFVKGDHCGTYTGYSMGCKQRKCREASRTYHREYARKKYGKDAFVTVDSIRSHLNFLLEHGAVQRRIAERIGTKKNYIWQLMNKDKYVFRYKAEIILAMNLSDKELFVHKQKGNMKK